MNKWGSPTCLGHWKTKDKWHPVPHEMCKLWIIRAVYWWVKKRSVGRVFTWWGAGNTILPRIRQGELFTAEGLTGGCHVSRLQRSADFAGEEVRPGEMSFPRACGSHLARCLTWCAGSEASPFGCALVGISSCMHHAHGTARLALAKALPKARLRVRSSEVQCRGSGGPEQQALLFGWFLPLLPLQRLQPVANKQHVRAHTPCTALCPC